MLKIVENLWAVGALPRTPLGELTAFPRIPELVGRGFLSPPQELYGLSVFPMENPVT